MPTEVVAALPLKKRARGYLAGILGDDFNLVGMIIVDRF